MLSLPCPPGTRQCVECGESSPFEELFRDISLDIPSRTADGLPPTLPYLLRHFFEDDDVEYSCERDDCGGKASHITHTLGQLPRILVLHIKRFRVNKDGVNVKLSYPINFPRELDMGKVPLGCAVPSCVSYE